MLISRTGNVDKSGTVPLNVSSKIRVPDETVTYYDRGALDTTGRALDFALLGDGFFEIQTPENLMVYTRNGSFTLDDQGYLYLQHEMCIRDRLWGRKPW